MTIFETMTKKWNEKATDTFRHIEITDQTIENYKRYLFEADLKDKTVIDYGCGGGYLGRYLFEEKGIKKYIGFDICDNSVKHAKENLKEFNAKIYKVEDYIDFTKYKADVLISFECIQHFPNKQYVDRWLKTVNESGCEELVLQYRIGLLTFIGENVMTWMCKLPLGYIGRSLTNYNPIKRGKWGEKNIRKECIYFQIKGYEPKEEEIKEDVIQEIKEEAINDKSQIDGEVIAGVSESL
jgi:SAM-dependent methyltransferase